MKIRIVILLSLVLTFNACQKSSEHIKDVYIPDRFTPNGDGINDYFYPKGLSLEDVEKMKVRILDENNQCVFSSEKSYIWDGTDRHENACSAGYYTYSFWFRFSDNTKEIYTGIVRLN